MNNHTDEQQLRQIDDLLERGKRSDDPVLNLLASAVPQADTAFEQKLEKRLMARLQPQPVRRRVPLPAWGLAAALLIAVVVPFALTRLRNVSTGLSAAASQVPIEATSRTMVIATRNIGAGETINKDMLALVTLSDDAYAALQADQPDRRFFTRVSDVVGQVATVAVFRGEPIEPIKLGQRPTSCSASTPCVALPPYYYTVDLSRPLISPEEQGLVAGDTVDVLAAADGQLSVIVRSVLLADVQVDHITFAAPVWKQAVLIWLWGTHQPYSLSRANEVTPENADKARVEYRFTSPDVLPDGFRFDLIAEFPISESFRLADARDLDQIHYTQQDTQMTFWFTDLDVVSVTGGTQVVIRLPRADAAGLDFLLKQGAKLTFNPDADSAS